MAKGDDVRPTTTQTAPNISTEHQAEGDARRPRDTLDREKSGRDDKEKFKQAGRSDGQVPQAAPPRS